MSGSKSIRLLGLVLLAYLGVFAGSLAAKTEAPPQPICGVISDPAHQATAALLEQQLAAGGRVRLVERDALRDVLREQSLATAFAPAQTGSRVEIGRLAKADLLVLLRSAERAKDAKREIDLVICETKLGVRLCTRSLPSDGAETDAQAIVSLVNEAVERYSSGAYLIVAVPPFVNRDLTFEFDYLQGALARVAEQRLLQRPRTWVVELAEAESIEREAALTGDGKGITRLMPLYVTGEFRHTGQAEGRRLTLNIAVRRQDREVGKLTRGDLSPNDAATVITAGVDTLVSKAAGKTPPSTAPATAPAAPSEAEQLAQRAKLFLRLGHWPEAIDLIEASLLLKPDQPDLHRGAVLALSQFLPQRGLVNGALKVDEGRRRRPVLDYYERGLIHLESYARATKLTDNDDQLLCVNLLMPLNPMYDALPEDQQKTAADLSHKILGAILAFKARERVDDQTTWLIARTYVDSYPPAQREAVGLKLVDDFTFLTPHFRRGVVRSVGPMTPINFGSDECLSFYEKASKHADPEIRREALGWLEVNRNARKAQDAEAAGKPLAVAEPPKKPVVVVVEKDPQVVLTKIELPGITRVSDWSAAGEGLDVFVAGEWSRSQTYVLPEKAKPERLVGNGDVSLDRLRDLRFDGRYVWAVGGHPRVFSDVFRRLVVFDPRDGRAWEFGPDDGLPRTREYDIAVLSPGRACVVGWFGRTWCAVLGIDDNGKKSVRMVREFQLVPERKIDETPGPDDAFIPDGLAVVRDPALAALPAAQVPLERLAAVVGRVRINLGSGKVDVIKDHVWNNGGRDTTADAAGWYAWGHNYLGDEILRVGFADEAHAKKLAIDGKYSIANQAFRHIADRYYVVGDVYPIGGSHPQGRYWAIADKWDGPYRSLRLNWPAEIEQRRHGLMADLRTGSHYPLVMLADGDVYEATLNLEPPR